MKRRSVTATLALTVALLGLIGCGSDNEEANQVPRLLRQRFETEMKTILQDVKVAEEQAMAFENSYLELPELRRKYLTRTVPESYALTVSGVSAEGFEAEIVHTASGLRCKLSVGGSGAGIPECS
jgi:hypothetical protein